MKRCTVCDSGPQAVSHVQPPQGGEPSDYMGREPHPSTFGHYGASGSVAWADPEADLAVVLLTNRAWQSWWPVQEGRVARLANTIVSRLD
jgi:CubicO group peptidase (beta-lactamase class C family)